MVLQKLKGNQQPLLSIPVQLSRTFTDNSPTCITTYADFSMLLPRIIQYPRKVHPFPLSAGNSPYFSSQI